MKPVVSVLTITYNHSQFIEQCINSILMQKTNFQFEIVIGEDCSTDGTREKVMQYAQKYPDLIQVITTETNVGAKDNLIRTLAACQGDLIAVCEGDDYWTDPNKLQKQVDFLNNHPEYSMCCHASRVKIGDGVDHTKIIRMADGNKTFTISDFLEPMSNNFIRTESVVLRKSAVSEIPDWIFNSPVADYPLFLLMAHRGKIYYIDQVMSVYRRHAGGIWTSNMNNADYLEKYYNSTIVMYQKFDQSTGYIYHKKIQKRIPYRYYQMIMKSQISSAERRKYFLKYWSKIPKHLIFRSIYFLYIKPLLGRL